MAKRNLFQISGNISNADSISTTGYVFSAGGITLTQGAIQPDGHFDVVFRSKRNTVRGILSFVDLDPAPTTNFFNGDHGFYLAPNEATSFRAKAKQKSQRCSYAFSLSYPVASTPPPPTPVPPVANRISLTPSTDIYSETEGGRIIGDTLVDNGKRLTKGQDLITAEPGTLNNADDIADVTTGDNDQISLFSNSINSLSASLSGAGSLTRLVGIEHLIISGNNDPGGLADLGKISGVTQITVGGSFQSALQIRNGVKAGARRFSFSGMTGSGIDLRNLGGPDNTTDEPLTILGSALADVLEGSEGRASIDGGSGDDRLSGGGAADTLIGGRGADQLTGGGAADTLTGGLDQDLFRYTGNGQSARTGVLSGFDQGDRIIDFEVGSGGDVVGFVNAGGFGVALERQANSTTLSRSFTNNSITLITLDATRLAAASAGKAAVSGNAAILVINTTGSTLTPASNSLAGLNSTPGLQIIGLEGQVGMNYGDFVDANISNVIS